MRAGVVGWFLLGADDGLHVEETLVHPHLQDPGDGVLGLTLDIAPAASHPELPHAHVARGAGNDLVGRPVAVPALEILVPVVRRAHEPALDPNRVPAAAPGTARVLRAWRANRLWLTVLHVTVGCTIEVPAIPHDVDSPGARLGEVHAIQAHAQTGTVRPQWYIRPPLAFARLRLVKLPPTGAILAIQVASADDIYTP